jgi:hypothetical protein
VKQEQKQKMSKNKLLSTKEFGKRNKVAFIFTPKKSILQRTLVPSTTNCAKKTFLWITYPTWSTQSSGWATQTIASFATGRELSTSGCKVSAQKRFTNPAGLTTGLGRAFLLLFYFYFNILQNSYLLILM